MVEATAGLLRVISIFNFVVSSSYHLYCHRRASAELIFTTALRDFVFKLSGILVKARSYPDVKF